MHFAMLKRLGNGQKIWKGLKELSTRRGKQRKVCLFDGFIAFEYQFNVAEGRSKECNLLAIQSLYDPQEFADKLYRMLESKKIDKYEVNIVFCSTEFHFVFNILHSRCGSSESRYAHE